VKRSATLLLCLATVAVGVWVMSGAQTLNSVCALGTQSGGGGACDYRLPFDLLGVALIATGVVTMIVSLITFARTARRDSARRERSTISTLHADEVDSLRDVA
jgi:hypothetical protein